MANDNEDEEKSGAGEEDKSSRMDQAKAFFRAMYAGDEPSQTATQEPPVDTRRVQELENLVRELEQRTNEAEGLYRRMAADFDNFRRRTEREREESVNVGIRKAADAFIPALDDLDRALLYLNPETPVNKVLESFQLVNQRIFTCLEQCGLKRMVTAGELFDPRFHEPVQQVETTEHPDGSIVHELRAGYLLGEKVIRPALVNVASNPTMEIPQLTPEAAPEAVPEQSFTEAKTETSSGAGSESQTATAAQGGSSDNKEVKKGNDGVFDLDGL